MYIQIYTYILACIHIYIEYMLIASNEYSIILSWKKKQKLKLTWFPRPSKLCIMVKGLLPYFLQGGAPPNYKWLVIP